VDTFAGKEQPLYSALYLFVRGPWFIKYRVSCPEALGEAVRSEAIELIQALTVSIGASITQ